MESKPTPISRRKFAKNALLMGVAVQLPWVMSCTESSEEERILSYRETILDILFPSNSDGPGAIDLFANEYINWVVTEPNVDPSTAKYILDGFDKFAEKCQSSNSKDFMEMTREQQEFFVNEMSKDSWGKSWLSRILTCILEALLCHPMYKINPEQSGWLWLNHNPGRPDPKPELMYPQILKTIREN